MKQILIALLAAWVTCSVVNAQNQTNVNDDSQQKAKVTITNKKKADDANSSVTVISVDANAVDDVDVVDATNDANAPDDADTTSSTNAAAANSSAANAHRVTTHQGSANFVFDDDDFPFNQFGNAVGGGILVAIVAIVMVFGFPVFVLFVIFFFRYKNRKARYRLAEQAIAAGRPLPENFLKDIKTVDPRSQGIKNTFTGIGLFVFLWGITGEFSIGTIGLLVMFMGLGQWLIGATQKKETNTHTQERQTVRRTEEQAPVRQAEEQETVRPSEETVNPSEDVNDGIR